MSMLEAAVIKAVCEGGGAVEYERLLLELSAAGVEGAGPGEDLDLDAVVRSSGCLTAVQRNNCRQVLIRTSLKICRKRECDRTCRDLHLCRFDLLGHCGRRRCSYGHSLDTEHNSRVLRERNLHELNKDQLRILLLQSDTFLLPNVCVSYNKGSGEYGNCPDKEACLRLHICENYIRGTCDGIGCSKSCHDFYEPHPMKSLEAKGVPSQLIGSLLVIYGNLLALKDFSNARAETGARRRVDTKFNNRDRVPESLQKNTENVICLSFVKGFCKFGEKCWRIHFDMPYKWEVEVDQVWTALPDNEAIERDYCDPAKMHSVGIEPVCFDTMVLGLHKVRRLSTDSSVLEPTFILTTKWQWYWENEYHKWIQYASIKEMHRMSSITSDELEQKYLEFLKDSNNAVITFTAGRHSYELNFKEMKQKNEISDTERMVRRRPQFFSSIDVKRAKTRRGVRPSSHKGVPGFWDQTAIPDSGYQRVLLCSSDKDYVRVQDHFQKTLTNFNILKLERIQNKELWEDFQTKRERMKKANKDKKYAEGERFLFHGTRSTLIDPICLQNFDMRVSGANGTVYGQGSYFARDAKYSHDYTDGYGEKYMFVCRVLVGHYTKGASHYRRPPPKDSLGTLFDSCVNDVREPTIYVVFDRTQVYPEFLITYKERSVFQPSVCTLAQSSAQSANFTDTNPPFTPTALAVVRQVPSASVSRDLTAAAEASVKSDDNKVLSPKTSVYVNTNQTQPATIQTAPASSCNSTLAALAVVRQVPSASLSQDLTAATEASVKSDVHKVLSPTISLVRQAPSASVSRDLPAATIKSDDHKLLSPQTSLSANTNQSESTKIHKESVSSCNSDALLDSWISVNPSSLNSEFSHLEADFVDPLTPTKTTAVVFDHSLAASPSVKSSSAKYSSSSNTVHSYSTKTPKATLPSNTFDTTKAKPEGSLQDWKKSVNHRSSSELAFLKEDIFTEFGVHAFSTNTKPAVANYPAASSSSAKESSVPISYKASSPSAYRQPYSHSSLSRSTPEISGPRSPPPKPEKKCILQ
ncbi:protein mono-ADP-ribosyltransferase PARP12 [Astyanax mexicanus]|uniref:protein mono-ADP-ribosyltransferase PARP12 n=1 Tax=Astyanax mexicanus TaxID=7994 RepID=UPI0020CB149E|nr:protein mono-ADP-ribosyltransferase PARP12 [Astyanax mexicanus]